MVERGVSSKADVYIYIYRYIYILPAAAVLLAVTRLMINVIGPPQTEPPWYLKAEYIIPIVTVIISSIVGPIIVGRYGQKQRSKNKNRRKKQ